jgi:beta-lactam-binding protein with PASTA domain/tRNA A-37 threonylcarbamoyl transferase component Bud32
MAEGRRVFNDRYELVRKIARGGMAEVFAARDLLLDRQVALKVLFPELSVDPAFVERFRREAQAAASLSHPNIVSVYDWGEFERTYYIVMEFVDGRPLSQVLRTEGPLAPERAALIAADVAAALSFAHRHGVVHRDVKPGNVLITDDNHVKVTDFGIARAANTQENLTQTGAVIGTATYFSPEQARGDVVDARSDLYSLGVVLFEMVCGQPPFVADSPLSVAYKHVREEPPRPRSINPAVPAGLEAIIGQALAKNPAARYQSAQELRADLLRFSQGLSVSAVAPLREDEQRTQLVGSRDAPSSATSILAATAVAAPPMDSGERTSTLAAVPGGPPPGGGAEPRRSRAWGWGIAIVLLLLALAAVIVLLARSLGVFSTAEASFSLPNVVGEPASQAVGLLQGEHLSVKETDRTSSSATPGTVVAENPSAGTKVHKGETILLTVAVAPKKVSVPSVVGDTIAQATSTLESKGFSVVVTHKHSTSATPDTVISESPTPGSSARRGSAITLVVAEKPSTIDVPDVSGKSVAAASNLLGQDNLLVGTTSDQSSSTVPAGDVIGTSPAVGTAVKPGSTVNLIVSSGPAQATVPSVVGDTEQAAVSTLQGDGFTVRVRYAPVTNPKDSNVVLRQDPAAGATAATGSTVSLLVGGTSSSSSSSTTTSSTTTTTTAPPTGGARTDSAGPGPAHGGPPGGPKG